jgi:hypothetical protein
MQEQSDSKQLQFQGLGKRSVVAAFDGGTISSDAGALLLREVDRAQGLLERFSRCFVDGRDARYIEHTLQELLCQRVMGICLGYEDLNDHDELRRDPLLATVCGKLDPTGENRRYQRDRGKALAGKSTLNRLETFGVGRWETLGCKKIEYCEEAIDRLLVEVFLDSFRTPPRQIVLDVDATDDPLHGHQEGRFFHGYFDCYCYLPLYIFCDDHLLRAKLKTAKLDPGNEALPDIQQVVGWIRSRWPEVQIILRGDSGFCREEVLRWCEDNELFYVFGLARNSRLVKRIAKELKKARKRYYYTPLPHQAQKIYKELRYRTLKSWSRTRRVVAKAEYLAKGENPRFVVSNLAREIIEAAQLYEKVYCARGDMENRIKEQQLYLFADRTSSFAMRANQLRLYFSSIAYVLMSALRRQGLQGTEFAQAQCQTIRLKLLKIGAQVRISVRRIYVSLSSAYPYQDIFSQTLTNLKRAYPQLC